MMDFRKKYQERRDEWIDWYWNKATAAEKKLYDLISDYSEEYFSDFRFEAGSATDDFVKIDVSDDEGDSWSTETMDVPDELQYFDDVILKSFQYAVAPLEDGTLGSVNFADCRVTIIPQMINDDDGKATILH